MKDTIDIDGKMVHTLDALNPPGMFKDGKRLRDHAQKDILPTSGRLIPDFTGRQSIRDMFAKRPSLKPASTSDVSGGSPIRQDASSAESKPAVEVEDMPVAVVEIMASPSKHVAPVTSRTAPKRALSDKSPKARAAKKSKGSTAAPSQGPSKGQSQIMGFFTRKPKQDSIPEMPDPAASQPSSTGTHLEQDHTAPVEVDELQTSTPSILENTTHAELAARESRGESSVELNPAFIAEDPARDLEQSKTQWAQLLSKPQVPLCEHGEPCKLMLSKKKGPNFGRYFYMCTRPLGASGDKEVGTQWRCRSFIWK